MNKTIKGVLAGALMTPISSVVYYFGAWFVYPVESKEYTMFSAMGVGLVFGGIGVVYTLPKITIGNSKKNFGLPVKTTMKKCRGFLSLLTKQRKLIDVRKKIIRTQRLSRLSEIIRTAIKF